MDKAAFTQAFRATVDVSLVDAEKKLGKILDHNVIVRMFGAGVNGEDISAEEFIDRVYIDNQTFYRLIDVFVVEVRQGKPVIFARVSDHPPGDIANCWNGVDGPFKGLQPDVIVQK